MFGRLFEWLDRFVSRKLGKQTDPKKVDEFIQLTYWSD